MMLKFISFVMAFCIVIPSVVHAQRSDSIAAVVNDTVITYTELYDRMDLVIKSSRMPNTKDFKKRLMPQILTGLITETVQLQEAKKLGLETSQEEIDKGFAELAAQNNLKPKQFKAILKRDKIQLSTLEKQIESQLAWGKVIQSEIRPRVILTDRDIDDEFERLQKREGQQEYLLAEIFLPYGGESNATEDAVRKTADDLSQQLKKDVQKFPAAAKQFSQSATAATGGIMGWITLDQLGDDLSLAVKNMKKQKVSSPIKTKEGYHILFARDKRTIQLGAKTAQEKLRIKVAIVEDDASIDDFIRDVKGCLDIVKRTAKMKNARLQEYHDLVSNIPSNIVDAVKGVNIGETGQVIKAENRTSIPMLCGQEGSDGTLAAKRDIENRIGMNRMDTLQKQYLRDLVSQAYIERRV